MIGDEIKKRALEENDIVQQIGQEDSKKAIPLVKKVMKEQEKKDEAVRDSLLDTLSKTSKTSFKSYNTLLAELLMKRMSFVDFPPGWRWEVAPTKEGIVLEMQSPDGRYFRSGFTPTGSEIYDLNAVNVYGTRAENTIDKFIYKQKPLPRDN